MVDVVQKIMESGVIADIVMPFIILCLGWAKDKSDLKRKNKEIGHWKIKYKKIPTFVDMAMKIYKGFAVNLFVMQIVKVILLLLKKEYFILTGSMYLVINFLIIFIKITRDPKFKIEMLDDKKTKQYKIIVLYLIFGVAFFIEIHGRVEYIVEIVFIFALIIWAFWLLGNSDRVFILDHAYADIYVRGSEKTEFVEVGNIKKQGEWIIANRNVNGYNEEIRIKECEIIRIDYYGEPLMVVEKGKAFKR